MTMAMSQNTINALGALAPCLLLLKLCTFQKGLLVVLLSSRSVKKIPGWRVTPKSWESPWTTYMRSSQPPGNKQACKASTFASCRTCSRLARGKGLRAKAWDSVRFYACVACVTNWKRIVLPLLCLHVGLGIPPRISKEPGLGHASICPDQCAYDMNNSCI